MAKLDGVVVVVPDGFEKSPDASGDPIPSFVYKKVLDYVEKNYSNFEIWIAPANKFGFSISEE